MNQYLVIPQLKELSRSLDLANMYNLGFEYNDFFIPAVLTSQKESDDIINAYREVELPPFCTMHGAFYDVTVFSSDRDIRAVSEKRILTSMEYARTLQVKGIVFHTNYNPLLTAKPYRDTWLEMNVDFFTMVAKDYPDVFIYMENMFDLEPFELMRLAERMEKVTNFGVCFDYAHASISKVPVKEWAECLCKYIKHVHINDNDGVNDLHLAVGSGVTDWEEYALLKDNYFKNASVLIETNCIHEQQQSVEYLKHNGLL